MTVSLTKTVVGIRYKHATRWYDRWSRC